MTSPAKKLRSAVVKDGLDRAPHRAFLRATGMADDDMGKPIVGIANTFRHGPHADLVRQDAAAAGPKARPPSRSPQAAK